jgi:pimeloyl-ACP methyl ester carboxylesterase
LICSPPPTLIERAHTILACWLIGLLALPIGWKIIPPPIHFVSVIWKPGAALVAAAARPGQVGAVVSCAGRPDLVDTTLAKVEAPTLLIVGGNDDPAIRSNQAALSLLRCQKHLEIVAGATHLFETPDTVAVVANLALRWFKKYLRG